MPGPQSRARAGAQRRSLIELPLEFAIEELPVPRSLAGQTLMQLDLPHQFLLTALSYKPADRARPEVIPPPSNVALAEGDRLVLVGKRQDLAKFARA